MPNAQQGAFVFSSFVSFTACSLIFRHFFPGVLPEFSIDLLLGRPPKPQKPLTIYDKILQKMGITDVFSSSTTGMIAAALTAVAAFVIVSYFATGKRKPVLDPKEYKEFPLVEKIDISPNTALYRFGLPRSDDTLGVPIGQHITVAAEIDGKMVARSYTPTSSDDDRGHFDLVIKTYEKGNISRYVGNLKVGEKIKVKGPKGQFRYTQGMSKTFNMIAGGTGITPMYQIITHILYSPSDNTKINLIYANQAKDDILLKLELDELAARHKTRFNVKYVLERPPPMWDGAVGFVGKDLIQERFPAYDESVKTLMCGPPPMLNAMKKHLGELNFPPAQTISKVHDAVFCF